MKLRHPLLFRLVGVLGSGLVRRWMDTVEFRTWYTDPRTDPRTDPLIGTTPFVV